MTGFGGLFLRRRWSVELTAFPLFLIAVPFYSAGLLMNSGGIAKRLINLALLFSTGIFTPTNIAEMRCSVQFLVPVLQLTAIGGVMPAEKEQKYDEGIAAAVITATAVGQLIPPTTALSYSRQRRRWCWKCAAYGAWIPGSCGLPSQSSCILYESRDGGTVKRQTLTKTGGNISHRHAILSYFWS